MFSFFGNIQHEGSGSSKSGLTMSTIRYTKGGNYDAADSLVADIPDGPIDLVNQNYIKIQIDGDGYYIISNDSQQLLLNTDAPLTEQKPLVADEDGIYVDLSDSASHLTLWTGEMGDVLIGGSGDDSLKGGGGSDILEGGLGNNTINGGSGINTVSYEHFTSSGVGISVLLFDGVAYDGTGGGSLDDTLSGIQNIRGSVMNDGLYGDSANNVIEGGGGADTINGMSGTDTASYQHSASGVTVNLTTGVANGGDATGDTLSSIENLLGSTHGDDLTGNAAANTLTGNGGADALSGGAGNDRLVISDTPTTIDGGDDTDFLFVTGGGSVSLEDATFTGIEAVYVRNDTTLDMSGVTVGSRIVSQSTSGHGVGITGTSGADRILAGKGSDVIEGGAGGDKLFAGADSDTFHFEAGFGRDNVYGFDVTTDRISVDIAGIESGDIRLAAFHGGDDTIVTFAGIAGTNKIILHDVTVEEITTGPSALFMFGA